jgi:hypothetical protein
MSENGNALKRFFVFGIRVVPRKAKAFRPLSIVCLPAELCLRDGELFCFPKNKSIFLRESEEL